MDDFTESEKKLDPRVEKLLALVAQALRERLRRAETGA